MPTEEALQVIVLLRKHKGVDAFVCVHKSVYALVLAAKGFLCGNIAARIIMRNSMK